jgi:hypothetical protein
MLGRVGLIPAMFFERLKQNLLFNFFELDA